MTTERRVGRAAAQAAPESEIDRQAIGARLKSAREYLELSQDEVAKALGLPRTAISMIENGQRKVDAIELKKLAEIYQQPITHFTGEQVASTPMSESVQHLARAAAKLTDTDREELLRFAEFLKSRGRQ